MKSWGEPKGERHHSLIGMERRRYGNAFGFGSSETIRLIRPVAAADPPDTDRRNRGIALDQLRFHIEIAKVTLQLIQE